MAVITHIVNDIDINNTCMLHYKSFRAIDRNGIIKSFRQPPARLSTDETDAEVIFGAKIYNKVEISLLELLEEERVSQFNDERQ